MPSSLTHAARRFPPTPCSDDSASTWPGPRACPGLADKHVTVHTRRHTAAMGFLDAGIDAAVIALWLGQESIATTSIYLHADMAIKRKALDRTRQPGTPAGDYQAADPLLSWLHSL
jgi:integrase/recombinase XerD